MHKTLFFFYLLWTITLSGQEAITLEGRVLNDTIEKASLTVVNISLKKGAITNEAGVFKIPVRVADTIIISAVQYEPFQFVVTDAMYQRKKHALYLVPKINELNEVVISDRFLSGDLSRDARDSSLRDLLDGIQKAANQGLFTDRKIPTPEARRLQTATTGIAENDGNQFSLVRVPLPALINGLSGKTKRLRKHVEASRFLERVQQTRARYPDSLYIHTLKIPSDRIEDFITYVLSAEDIATVEIENSLLFLEHLRIKAVEYVALRRKEEELSRPRQ